MNSYLDEEAELEVVVNLDTIIQMTESLFGSMPLPIHSNTPNDFTFDNSKPIDILTLTHVVERCLYSLSASNEEINIINNMLRKGKLSADDITWFSISLSNVDFTEEVESYMEYLVDTEQADYQYSTEDENLKEYYLLGSPLHSPADIKWNLSFYELQWMSVFMALVKIQIYRSCLERFPGRNILGFSVDDFMRLSEKLNNQVKFESNETFKQSLFQRTIDDSDMYLSLIVYLERVG